MKFRDETRALSHTARGVKAASAARARAAPPEKICGACRIFLQCVCDTLMCRSPKFARACGRVSIGRHPDKRPDSRLRFESSRASHHDRQPEAKPAHPALNGGRGLKQRRSGLFWSGRPKVSTEEACPSCLAGRAERVSRSNPRQHLGDSATRLHRVPNARSNAGAPQPLTPVVRAQARAAELQRGPTGAKPLGPLNWKGARQ